MENKAAKKLTGQATDEQVKEWKDKHGKVFAYETPDGRICYLKSVDRNTYSVAAAKISTSPAKFNETIVTNCWLGGDETIKNKDEYFFGLIDFIEELMAKKKGTLTEL